MATMQRVVQAYSDEHKQSRGKGIVTIQGASLLIVNKQNEELHKPRVQIYAGQGSNKPHPEMILLAYGDLLKDKQLANMGKLYLYSYFCTCTNCTKVIEKFPSSYPDCKFYFAYSDVEAAGAGNYDNRDSLVANGWKVRRWSAGDWKSKDRQAIKTIFSEDVKKKYTPAGGISTAYGRQAMSRELDEDFSDSQMDAAIGNATSSNSSTSATAAAAPSTKSYETGITDDELNALFDNESKVDPSWKNGAAAAARNFDNHVAYTTKLNSDGK